MVVFRDDRGVKQQLFDSQSHSENDEVRYKIVFTVLL